MGDELEARLAEVKSEREQIRWIAQSDCVAGTIYALHSRNLTVGVYDGVTGFIGIREKFGHRYLFTEYHRGDADLPRVIGTVTPLRVLGALPVGIPVREYVRRKPRLARNLRLQAYLADIEHEEQRKEEDDSS